MHKHLWKVTYTSRFYCNGMNDPNPIIKDLWSYVATDGDSLRDIEKVLESIQSRVSIKEAHYLGNVYLCT